ncbi:YbhB/YbcL family Raf kinase inhibitor-like protein [Herbidospora mongoliensis]|uniref:YbhB/YbcL family Raf kinase inhibitor-like protein n=1 Tax=Herbidospora mongoliensis TaxID=688067 RepID=UPI00083278F7|nr:YbhB/YbcL family Raf kinase inhibitor-like protein [Herbidospora mongoliensis]
MPTPPPIPYDHLPEVAALTVEASGLADGHPMSTRHVFNDWGFSGENVSPHLTWSGAPEGTQSYAVTCFDPDAPTGSGFWHWLVYDIPASVTELPEGAGNGPAFAGLPEGATHARNDYGTNEYGGAAPPPGWPHRYLFAVHALDVDKLGVDPGANPAVIGFNITAHTLARGFIAPVYES